MVEIEPLTESCMEIMVLQVDLLNLTHFVKNDLSLGKVSKQF